MKEEKMAGLLPGGERAVCTEEQDEKALYKGSFYSGPLLPLHGTHPLPAATSALNTLGLTAEVP